MKLLLGSNACLFAALFSALLMNACSSPINSINDPHFDKDGHCLDSLEGTFHSTDPASLAFYVEVSGSMNGFFRANRPTAFKSDVWNILSHYGNPGVSVLSNDGSDVRRYSSERFRQFMNEGRFVSTAETRVPTMLQTIISNLDWRSGKVAVLISDMKYSPAGSSSMKVLLEQYSTDISSVFNAHKGLAAALICAQSEYIAKNGESVCDKSPYYYLVLGKDSQVASVRNCIQTLLADKDRFVDEVEAGFDYGQVPFGFGQPHNAIQLSGEPTFYNFDRSYSDTCTVRLNLDLSDFRWIIADEQQLRNNLKVSTVYGSLAEVGQITILSDNHFDKSLKRRSIAIAEIKVYDMPLGADVIEWNLNQPEFTITPTFATMLNASQEGDYSGSFSVSNFIQGMFGALRNTWSNSENRILISKSK